MTVYTYWTGEMPPLIRLCLASIARHCPGSECWDQERFKAEYDGSLGEWTSIAKQLPNVQSDILRAWLLYSRGGVWLDADCILFRDVSDILGDWELATYRAGRLNVCTALIACRAGNLVISDQCQAIRLALKQGHVLAPQSLGPNCFGAILAGHRRHRILWIPHGKIHPEPWWESHSVKKRIRSAAAYRFAHGAYGFMLTHRVVAQFRGETEESLMSHPSVIGQALRLALGDAS